MSLKNGCVGYWGFNSLIPELEQTGSSSNLTNRNNVTFGSGKIGPAAQFDGINGLEITSDQYPDLDNIFSVSCWVKTYNAGEFIGTWSAGGQFVINSWNFPTLDNNFGVSLFNENGSSDNLTSSVYAVDNEWHHVALTLDGKNAVFYVDGKVQDTRVYDYRPEITKRGFFVGSVDQTAGLVWDGLIDEVGIWNRSLTVKEVTTLYNSGSGITYPFTVKKGTNNFKKILGLPDYTSKVTTFDFLNLPFYIGNSKSAPVPDDGLILYLDAGNTSSYNHGSTWTDLKSGLVFDLYNSPVYDSRYGGSLFFAPTAQNYAKSRTTLPSLSSWTLEAWHYFNNTNTGNFPTIITQEYISPEHYINFNLGTDTLGGNSEISTGFFNSDQNFWYGNTTDRFTLTNNTWNHIVGTFDGSNLKLYINGLLMSSVYDGNNCYSNGNPIVLMKRWDYADYWGGNLGIVRIYDKALDFTQVYQKYDSTKDRFSLPPFTNRIILNNTSLANESPFSSGKSYSFNGSDQFIEIGNSNDFSVGNNDFTVEWFQKMTVPKAFSRPFSIGAYNLGNTEFAVSYEGGVFYLWTPTSSPNPIGTFNSNDLMDTWHHVALVRISNTFYVYVDGSFIGACGSAAFNDGSTHLTIGSETDIHDPSAFFGGYITNFRWTNQVVYSGEFTPPTTKLRLTQNGDGGNIQAITDSNLVKVLLVP